MKTRLLLVEDDAAFARRLAKNLGLDGFEAEIAEGGEAALEFLRQQEFDAILCDVKMAGMTGLDLLRNVRTASAHTKDPAAQELAIDSELPFLMLTSVTSVETAVQAMQLGASDYLTKEAGRAEIVLRLKKALGERAVAEENKRLRETFERMNEFGELVGNSPELEKIKDEIRQVAELDATVMVTGETGVGKELVARAIHQTSGRKGDFIDVNCALLPNDMMLQSELFGHERGAFTDAKTLRKGKFELADGGTLFMDEVGELGPEVQAKLLRALETMSFTRVGGTQAKQVNVRVIVATNRNLQAEVKAGRFRDDLYYRLNVYPLEIPPLRNRKQDIAPLAEHFLSAAARKYGRPEPRLSPEAQHLMSGYHWPGNIRELRNICERLLIRARGGNSLFPADLQQCGLSPTLEKQSALIEIPEDGVQLDDIERTLVIEALRRCHWNQTDAARLIGISTDRMNNRVKKYGLTHDSWRRNRDK
ncbi:MAG: sigma-54-dependent transcriptional regulator [Sumerlaeia bacterium]